MFFFGFLDLVFLFLTLFFDVSLEFFSFLPTTLLQPCLLDYSTDEDANPDTAEEGRATRAAAGSSGGHSGSSSGSSKRGEVAKKKKEEDQAVADMEMKEMEKRKESKDADAFRKLLAAGINVGWGGGVKGGGGRGGCSSLPCADIVLLVSLFRFCSCVLLSFMCLLSSFFLLRFFFILLHSFFIPSSFFFIQMKKFATSSRFKARPSSRVLWLDTRSQTIYWQKGKKNPAKVKSDASLRTLATVVKSVALFLVWLCLSFDLFLILLVSSFLFFPLLSSFFFFPLSSFFFFLFFFLFRIVGHCQSDGRHVHQHVEEERLRRQERPLSKVRFPQTTGTIPLFHHALSKNI